MFLGANTVAVSVFAGRVSQTLKDHSEAIKKNEATTLELVRDVAQLKGGLGA